MAFESKREPGKKFGSIYRQRRFDSYNAGEQPAAHALPQDEHLDKPAAAEEHGAVEAPEAVVKAHGPAHTVEYTHDHENGKHDVKSQHEDAYEHVSSHSSVADAYGHGKALTFEAGGEEQATSPKKRQHTPQQGAESEERGYEQPDLV